MFKKIDLRPLLKYLRPYKRDVWLTSAFVILENGTYLILPLIYSQVVDTVTRGGFFERSVYLLLALWAILQIGGGLLMRVRVILSNKLGYRASADLINNSIKHLISLPVSFHKRKKVGEVIQKFSRADGYLYSLVDYALFTIIPYLVTSFLAFIVIFWINWILALIFMMFILFFVVVTIKKTNPIIVSQGKMNKFFEKYYGDVFDRTPNIIAIKSNAQESTENERNFGAMRKGLALSQGQVVVWMNLYFWQNLISTVSVISLFGIGIYLVSINKITIGQFVMLIAYINFASNAINMLGGHYKKLQEGIATIKRSEKIFNEIPEVYDVPNAVKIKNPKGDIEFKNISFSYEDEKVLENINFKVLAGKMVAIIGKSGEGKSTLVDLISRYNIPQKGQILFDGVETGKINLKDLRDNIAIVPQEIDLFNDSIKNNIAYAKLDAVEEEIVRAAKLANCHEFISKFPKKYEQIVGEKGVRLSTGQKQRVAIARAILRNPRILILDEATSALDSESEKYVQSALEEVMKNRTTFVIAHRLSTIRKADLILVLEGGKIVESGDHQELMNHGGVYKKLSELQNIQV
ncbi:MAG: ABC-type multidrug transport system, ATPase and permease component [Candidatus Moranbacteria bacterium GW2011_GWE1_35_17]|nr:MAG: ABC-type multidrug transport system, ATPase and permease component [Candidatus Moranbacteria bacterium GW2011_GWE1_35_17]KKP73182.1 MAG: ABC-type multidrug transport system, ATPase and permease component [Candidatus Moranbacteria bacterium GW2011_GWE2_35_164]KKP82754.1 MAG: ABC-type multidrug transport system, ATPase and permease component [Candidatus Moranbacteria bacterium GW2011_GWF1_35_5]KKP84903.1 MAG: ABC-type multidrug transport system, ATPase and permease component [Candidatus Mo